MPRFGKREAHKRHQEKADAIRKQEGYVLGPRDESLFIEPKYLTVDAKQKTADKAKVKIKSTESFKAAADNIAARKVKLKQINVDVKNVRPRPKPKVTKKKKADFVNEGTV